MKKENEMRERMKEVRAGKEMEEGWVREKGQLWNLSLLLFADDTDFKDTDNPPTLHLGSA